MVPDVTVMGAISSGLLGGAAPLTTCLDVSVVLVEPGVDADGAPLSRAPIRSLISRRIQDKNVKYAARCAALGHRFVPFVLSSLGGLSKPAVNFMKSLAATAGDQELDPFRSMKFLPFWMEHLSVVWQATAGDSLYSLVTGARSASTRQAGSPSRGARPRRRFVPLHSSSSAAVASFEAMLDFTSVVSGGADDFDAAV
jgi:hypothetical protein